jgi:hypothetical protein
MNILKMVRNFIEHNVQPFDMQLKSFIGTHCNYTFKINGNTEKASLFLIAELFSLCRTVQQDCLFSLALSLLIVVSWYIMQYAAQVDIVLSLFVNCCPALFVHAVDVVVGGSCTTTLSPSCFDFARPFWWENISSKLIVLFYSIIFISSG